jgi:hypothetical protein
METGWFFNRYKAQPRHLLAPTRKPRRICKLRDLVQEIVDDLKAPLVALCLLRFLLKMKHVSYNGYVITVTANNEKGTWRSHVIITWYAGKFDLHDEVCFTTEMEAEEHAVESGKHWVNNRLQILKGSS